MTIRWEQTSDGNLEGLSGELVVATVTKDRDDGQGWLWTITALKRPKGWRKPAGHRTSVLDARGAADDYWSRWLAAVALKPDLPKSCKAKPQGRARVDEGAGSATLVSQRQKGEQSLGVRDRTRS